MPSYFQQDRFKPLSETLFEDRSTLNNYPRTHEIDDRKRSVQAINPTARQIVARQGPSLLELGIKAMQGYVRLQKDTAILNISNEVADQLPTGKDYTIVISSPGNWGGDESVQVFSGNRAPNILHDPNVELNIRTVTGRGKAQTQPAQISYKGSNGKTETVTVSDSSLPTNSMPAPRRRNVVEREPGGMQFREPKQLPADSRFDRSYPGARDFGGLA